MKKLVSVLISMVMMLSNFTMVYAAGKITLGEPQVYTLDGGDDEINLSFSTTGNDSFYRITVKNLSVNDNICMSLTDKYDEELAKYDYWSYIGKGAEKYVDLKLDRSDTFYVAIWANGKIETGNYELCIKELVDDVPDIKNNGDIVQTNTAYVRSIDANNDIDFYRWSADKTKLSITLKNNSINDNMCMIVYDKYDAELAKFDYWSYVGKGAEKKIDIDTTIGETYYISVWSNGKIETGDYKICIGNENRIVDKKTSSQSGITVLVNGASVSFDQPPVVENGRTLVPLRAIFEALGANVGWDQDTQTVSASKSGIQISLKLGSTKMYVNGSAKTLDVPAKVINSRTLVPVRAVSEAFGCDVQWDGNTQTVIITE